MVEITTSNIEHAADYSSFTGTRALLIAHKGQIIFEQYLNHASPDIPLKLASGTKSFCAGLLATAVVDGLLVVDDLVSETIREWASHPSKSKITIRHLLSLTSGLNPGTVALNRPRVADAYQFAIELESVAPVGKRFIYGPGPFTVFAEIVRRRLTPGYHDVLAYLTQRVFDPIGLSIGEWRYDQAGNPLFHAGAKLTGREWVKYGQLICQWGNWGNLQILDTEAIK
jgi:CubicO group peptidase (beta-lactamase class C family)